PDRTDSAGRRTADVGAQTPRPLLRVRTLRRLHHPHDRAEHLRDWSETVNGWRLALSEADDLAVGRGGDAPHRIRVVIADDNPAFCLRLAAGHRRRPGHDRLAAPGDGATALEEIPPRAHRSSSLARLSVTRRQLQELAVGGV